MIINHYTFAMTQNILFNGFAHFLAYQSFLCVCVRPPPPICHQKLNIIYLYVSITEDELIFRVLFYLHEK